MKELDYKFYSELRSNTITLNQVPKGIKDSLQFQNLLQAKIIETAKSGRGSRIIIKNSESFESFFARYFEVDKTSEITKTSNIKKLKDSKARRTKSPAIFFLRGFTNIKLDNKDFDLCHYTKTFGLFSLMSPIISSNKICFVENLDSFLKAEKLFEKDFIYLHKYGRIGIDSLKGISASEIQVFVDYDFNGLDEYLRIKDVFENATLYIPESFEQLFNKYSKVIRGKQKQSKRVTESNLAEVIRIRELVSKGNRFLEQEILTND
jgi:hypothetical protein